MNHLEWALLVEKAYDFLAADKYGLFRDLVPEIERRIDMEDPYKKLRSQGRNRYGRCSTEQQADRENDIGKVKDILK